MSAPDLTSEIMDRFRSAGVESHSTILLGAGASVTSGLPNWDTFAIRLLLQSGSTVDSQTSQLLLNHQDPTIVVEAAKVAFGDRWEKALRKALYQEVPTLEPSPLHLAALNHYLMGDGPDTTLVTLNFDTLIEQAYQEETNQELLSHSDGSATDENEAVHHLHGVISPTSSHDVVLTLTDFYSLMTEKDTWQLRLLQQAVSRGALLIAGTSYRDPDLRQWLHIALREKPAHHTALVMLARESFLLSRREFDQVQQALRDQWVAIGLEPILLQDHADAAQIIRELRYLHRTDYLSPQERTMSIWEAHTNSFDRLQREYSDQLRLDASLLKGVLMADRLNLSLWLSNAQSGLVRWASQDRIYRDVSQLREIETGHDSSWIAGEALGAEEILFKDLGDGHHGQWQSVLALPILASHPIFPVHVTAVLTVGLPKVRTEFESLQLLWDQAARQVADAWGTRLSSVAFGDLKT
ncbi:SIR2 family protein [Jonesiaceae bacterium BS-20]|uniref:SIR2 family protein n=1 Tax=Jonesiaceae bacterium BS-20 TaxID=3120821 RepID=A0AAU7DX20_9MICO